MEHIMSGLPVAAALLQKASEEAAKLKEKGITPKLALLRVGESPEDLRYERNLIKKAAQIGAETEVHVLPENASEDDMRAAIWQMDEDHGVHGIMVFRPLPAGINEEAICQEINPEKDVDGATEGSLAGVFMQHERGFAPCTARAVMEMLDYYGVELSGKKVTVIGRSLVVGRPLACMLLAKNATVTIAHSKTADLAAEARSADILISATGMPKMVDQSYIREGQIVVDVGVAFDPQSGKLCGDVDFEKVEALASSITPVKGGVGAVTTAVLMTQVVEAAIRLNRKPSWTD